MTATPKYDRSAILGYAWTRARLAAAAAGESVRLHIGAAMPAAWSEAKAAAVAAMVPQPVQQQQAQAGIGPVCRGYGHARRQYSRFGSASDYAVHRAGDVLCVTDLNLGGMSVTNDAAGVIAYLASQGYDLARMPVIYRDSTKRWDEMVVKDGRFAGFRHLDTARKEALRAIANGLDVPPPDMVAQPCQQQQACAAQEAPRIGFEFDGRIYATARECQQAMLDYADDASESGDIEVWERLRATRLDTGEQFSIKDLSAVEAPLVEVEYGRATFTCRGNRIRFIGQVTGGGANGPGSVAAYTGYDKSHPVRYADDNRSGSRRSGSCTWDLEPNCLYSLSHVAWNSSRSCHFYLSTYDGGLAVLEREEFEAERRRLWPLQAEEHDAAQVRRREDEARRIEAERALAEERRVAREALSEMNAEAAARIKAEGQPRVGNLPKLTGTAKQVAYALNIRNAVMAQHPDMPELRTQRASRYWIENHRRALR